VTSEIEAGDIWPEHLSEAHARSRVIVAVLCYPFFESRWCCSEWVTACARDKPKQSSSVVVPVRYNDLGDETIKALPRQWRDNVCRRQARDLTQYSPLVNRLADNELALRFRREMEDFCEHALKPAILRAPRWNSKWPRLPSTPVITARPAFRARLAGSA
jgi:hypothetical protein